jgi:HD-GYP domain-containing protein (c-di-GMP phosphodiesterase class II)
VLQLVNARATDGQVVPFDPQDLAFVEALTAQAAVALENQLLVLRLEDLFSHFANLISVAIDEKSKHTSGHCQRVPTLTMMLAEAAAACTSGPLAEFQMSDAERRALQLAGNLHDCGKITTPEYVLDKSTKLFGLNDRIDLVEARLEVLKSEKKLQAAERLLKAASTGEAEERIKQWLETQIAIIEADQRFLRKTNFGVEKMQEDDMQRVQQIAVKEWTTPRGERQAVLSPEEVANLCIPYGTLTTQERQVINNHIVATIKMLESLPWPAHLKKVPEYAGGHHERMDGRGYPKGLTKEEMSVQARAMGIADIFEAVTAKDRPYKKPNTISESLQILGKMALGGHIDTDLFDVFVRQKVYMQYAEQFLDPSQIDVVDEALIPGYQP